MVSSAAERGHDILPEEVHECTLLHLLSNYLILCHTAPYLPVSSLLRLGATSKAFHCLIHDTPGVFRYLDLTPVKSVQFAAIDRGGESWRNVQLDENLTEDDFYSGPIYGILSALSRRDILRSVQTLVLDGLSVTSDVCHEILTQDSYAVRILSLRGCQHLNHRLLRGALEYACRPTRPEGTPHIRGLYIFGVAHDPIPELQVAGRKIVRAAARASASSGAGAEGRTRSSSISAAVRISREWNRRSRQVLAGEETPEADPHDGDNDESSHSSKFLPDDHWWFRRGPMFPHTISPASALTLLACRGIIAFDAVLCNGPGHVNSPAYGKVPAAPPTESSPRTPAASPWEVATIALNGCSGCGGAPEGVTAWGSRRESSDGEEEGLYPLLAPPPLHSSNIRAAMCPTGESTEPTSRTRPGSTDSEHAPRFVPRCSSCLSGRYCVSCYKWWCEICLPATVIAELKAADQVVRSSQNDATLRNNLCQSCEMARNLEKLKGHRWAEPRAIEV